MRFGPLTDGDVLGVGRYRMKVHCRESRAEASASDRGALSSDRRNTALWELARPFSRGSGAPRSNAVFQPSPKDRRLQTNASASASDVLNAVRSVYRGVAVCPPQLCSTLFRFVAQMAKEMPAHGQVSRPELTLRQQQLVSLVAKGLTNKEIASLLNLSEFTVRNHIHRILKQVDAQSRSEAVDVIRASGFVLNA